MRSGDDLAADATTVRPIRGAYELMGEATMSPGPAAQITKSADNDLMGQRLNRRI